MIIYTTRENIQHALDEANKSFDGNLSFNNFQRLSDTRHRVTLRVKDSHGRGARLGNPYFGTGGDPLHGIKGKARHLISACWHAHGALLDSLPDRTKVISRGRILHVGDEWGNIDIGSKLCPYWMSEACECNNRS